MLSGKEVVAQESEGHSKSQAGRNDVNGHICLGKQTIQEAKETSWLCFHH